MFIDIIFSRDATEYFSPFISYFNFFYNSLIFYNSSFYLTRYLSEGKERERERGANGFRIDSKSTQRIRERARGGRGGDVIRRILGTSE